MVRTYCPVFPLLARSRSHVGPRGRTSAGTDITSTPHDTPLGGRLSRAAIRAHARVSGPDLLGLLGIVARAVGWVVRRVFPVEKR